MNQLPDDILICIFCFLTPDTVIVLDKYSERLMKCNQVWGPPTFHKFQVACSNNFFQEYKWQKQLQRYRFDYKRQFTLGCVGKFKTFGEKPKWKQASTVWTPE